MQMQDGKWQRKRLAELLVVKEIAKILGQQAVGLVQQEVASDELLEAPIFALHKTISSAGGEYMF